jgi:hypothetical protein
MENTGKKSTSWGWIVFWFILFWPIGLILLFKRLALDKSATMRCHKTLFIISYILMSMGAIYLIMAFAEESTMFAAALLFGGGGIWVNRIAKKTKIVGERYKKYISLIVNQNQTYLDNIASAVGVPYKVVVNDLQKMIDAGYFAGAYIDTTKREIVLTQDTPQHVSLMSSAAQNQIKITACGSCGANNRVILGQIAECEYCGSPLQ